MHQHKIGINTAEAFILAFFNLLMSSAKVDSQLHCSLKKAIYTQMEKQSRLIQLSTL